MIYWEVKNDDHLVFCLRQVEARGYTPQIGYTIFTAPNSVMIGNVILNQKQLINLVWGNIKSRQQLNTGQCIYQSNKIYNSSQQLFCWAKFKFIRCTIVIDTFTGTRSTIKESAIVAGIIAAGFLVPQETEVKNEKCEQDLQLNIKEMQLLQNQQFQKNINKSYQNQPNYMERRHQRIIDKLQQILMKVSNNKGEMKKKLSKIQLNRVSHQNTKKKNLLNKEYL